MGDIKALTDHIHYTNSQDNKVAVMIIPKNLATDRKGNLLFPALLKIFRKGDLSASIMNRLFFMFIDTPQKGKFKKADSVAYLQELRELTDNYGIDTILVANADFYQYITADKKFLLNVGNVVGGGKFSYGSGKAKIEFDFSDLKILPMLNPKIVEMYPNRLNEYVKPFRLLDSVVETGELKLPEAPNIISNVYKSSVEIKQILKQLYKAPRLFVDIETTGLNWYKDELLTLSLCENDKEAHCIAIHRQYHSESEYQSIINILKSFFENYNGWLIGHNWLGFDQAFIIHEIMRKRDFSINQEPLINGFKIHDTLLMAYILKNSTERVSLKLKQLAYKYLGDWDKDIDQSDLINTPLDKVAKYNNYDVIATYYIYNELVGELKNSQFVPVYKNFVKLGYDLLKMKMTGLCFDYEKTKKVYKEMEDLLKEDLHKLTHNRYVNAAANIIAKSEMEKYNKTRKNKKTDLSEFWTDFNPSSSRHKTILFFNVMGLMTENKTKSGALATDKDTINEWLLDPNIDDDKKEVLQLILDYQASEKVRNTYLKNMLEGYVKLADDDYRIFSNFNQTGTISGRLSSQGVINMQTIPSGSKYGKMIKSLFIAPKGFIMGSSDFSALEDRLMANASQDPNKIGIFTSGIDGHSLNATAYFPEQMPDIIDKLEKVNDDNRQFFEAELIDGTKEYLYDDLLEHYQDQISHITQIDKEVFRVNVINSIKTKYKHLRQEGKSWTFGLNYLKSRASFGDKAFIYDNYWNLYNGVHLYNNKTIDEAKRQGYLISRYSGLRLNIPDIKSSIGFVNEKASRVAVNFSIQSGNFLTIIAIQKLQKWIEENDLISDVKIVNTIHDAIYLYIRKDPELVDKVNHKLIEFMCADYNSGKFEPVTVMLEAELDIGNNMSDVTTISNNATVEEITELLNTL